MFVLFFFSVSASVSMLAKPACRSAMPAGSSTVWSTASSRTDRCPATRPLVGVTIPSTRSSVRLVPASMCPVLCSWTWNPLLLVRNENAKKKASEMWMVGNPMLWLYFWLKKNDRKILFCPLAQLIASMNYFIISLWPSDARWRHGNLLYPPAQRSWSSVHENHRTCRIFPMARPKCLMRDFTNLNRIYKAHWKMSDEPWKFFMNTVEGGQTGFTLFVCGQNRVSTLYLVQYSADPFDIYTQTPVLWHLPIKRHSDR